MNRTHNKFFRIHIFNSSFNQIREKDHHLKDNFLYPETILNFKNQFKIKTISTGAYFVSKSMAGRRHISP